MGMPYRNYQYPPWPSDEPSEEKLEGRAFHWMVCLICLMGMATFLVAYVIEKVLQ